MKSLSDMKNFRLIAAFITLLLLLTSLYDNTWAKQTEEENHVIIISIDGFPAWSLWDERIPLPTIRSLANEGVWARAMIPSTPTVTWPNHTTLTTGVHPERHGMLTNGRFIRGDAGVPVYQEKDLDRDELSTWPTIYDVAYEAGLRTAEINWPVTRNAKTLHDSFPDAVDEVTHTTPQLRRELVELGMIREETEEAFQLGQPARDYIWTEAAAHLIRTRQPHVLLLHLLVVDGTHHRHGEGTMPGNTALAYADANIKVIMDALEEAGIRDRTTLFIVSDHGFMNITKQVLPNVLLRQNGLLEADDEGELTSARVHIFSNGGTAMVFATDPSSREDDLQKARSLFEQADGISRIIGPEEYEAYGLPQPAVNDGMGDLVIEAAEGHSFGNSAFGDQVVIPRGSTGGAHGYFSDLQQMETLFIVTGRGIQSGRELDVVDNRSVAPTAAELLGLTLEMAEGQILQEILE